LAVGTRNDEPLLKDIFEKLVKQSGMVVTRYALQFKLLT
jgi:hypothetical protein